MTCVKFNIQKQPLEVLLMNKNFSSALCMLERFPQFFQDVELSKVNGVKDLVMFCLCQPFDCRSKCFDKLNNYDCSDEEVRVAIDGRVFDFFSCCQRQPLSTLLINFLNRHHLMFRYSCFENEFVELIPYFVEGKWNALLLRTFFRFLTTKQIHAKLCDLDELDLINIIPLAIKNQNLWPDAFLHYVASSLRAEHVFDVMMNPDNDSVVKKKFLKLLKAPLIRNRSLLNDAIRFGWTEFIEVINDDFDIGIDEILFDEMLIREAVRMQRKEFISFVLRHDSFVDVVIEAHIDAGDVGVLQKTDMDMSNRYHIHFRNVCEKRLIEFIKLFDINEEMIEIMILNRIGVFSKIASRSLLELAFEAGDFEYICKFIHKHFQRFESRLRENIYDFVFRPIHNEKTLRFLAQIFIEENLKDALVFLLEHSKDKLSIMMIVQKNKRWDLLNGKFLPQVNVASEENAMCVCNVFEKNAFFRCGHFTHCWNCLRNDIVLVDDAIWCNCPKCLTIQPVYIINGCPPNERLYLDETLWKLTCDKTNFKLCQQ